MKIQYIEEDIKNYNKDITELYEISVISGKVYNSDINS
jgi:hypothetical protein